MNIAIDARILERKMTGVGRYLITFLNELPHIDKLNKYYLLSYDVLNCDKYFTNIPTIKSFLPQKLFSPIWGNFILPFYLKRHKIDLLFSVNQIIPLFKTKNCKYISVIHDVIFKADPNFQPFIYRKYLQLFAFFSIKRSDYIITVSHNSKQDLLKHYKVDADKIKVIYPAVDKKFFPMNLNDSDKKDIRSSLNLADKIVLYIGMIENRKNILGILNIADDIYIMDQDIRFLIIGKKGYGGKRLYSEIKKRKNVTLLNGVDDQLLKKIYNISSVFLFPSFYEGFGYPPLEAMQSGLPVLASNSSSLKEIIDCGGILIKPNDNKSFAENILKLINNGELYSKMKEKGIERAKFFNIENTTREIVNVFNSLSRQTV